MVPFKNPGVFCSGGCWNYEDLVKAAKRFKTTSFQNTWFEAAGEASAAGAAAICQPPPSAL